MALSPPYALTNAVERMRMMQAWADYLDELRNPGKVISLRRENA
jgi:hypothetical protein